MQLFLNEKGMEYLISLIKLRTIGLEQVWHIVVHLPTIFNKTTVQANERHIRSFTDTLINKFEVLPGDSLSQIIENNENVGKFLKNFEGMIELISSPYEKENYLETFGKFFQNRKNREEPPVEMNRISLLPSPRHKPPSGPLRNQRAFTVTPSKPDAMKNEGISLTTAKEIQELVDRKFEECMKVIEDRFNTRNVTENNLNLALQPHFSCDQQEFSVLATVEFLVSEGKSDEALKVIRWRKKILKIAALSGWDVARELARRTVFKLDVTVEDIVEVNCALNLGQDD
jgi:RNase H-fold protein (predicted Holliday junction resolvase)